MTFRWALCLGLCAAPTFFDDVYLGVLAEKNDAP